MNDLCKIIVLLICLCSAQLWAIAPAAASAGTVSGYVVDARTGEGLAGANIRIDNTSLGAASDLNGYFQVNGIPPANYSISASYLGYDTMTKYNLMVKSGIALEVRFALAQAPLQLDAVVVRPAPYSNPPETPLSIQQLSQTEIATYPGGNNDIAKVIQSLPGVSASPQGFRNDVIIRGGAPNENVYYLDGVEIPNINHFATQGSAGGPVGLLNVSFFEGVTLTTSSFPARYDNTLSSVLQFNQRNGNAQALQTNIRVGASETAVTLEGPLFKGDSDGYSKRTFIASLRRSYLQFLFKLIDLPFLPDYWDYQYKLNYKISSRNEIDIIGVGSIDDFSVNPPSDLDAEQRAVLDQVPVIKQWTTTAGMSWIHRFEGFTGTLRTTVSTNIFDNNFRRFRDNEKQTGLYFSNKAREQDVKFRSEFNRFAGAWTLATGILLQRSEYRNSATDLVDNVVFETDLTYYRYGFWAQSSREWLSGRLSATFGIRTDGNTFTASGDRIRRTLSPRLSISFGLDRNQKWRVNASTGRYYKLPPKTVLGFRNTNGESVNRTSDYIRSDHIVAGLSWNPETATLVSLEAFLKRYAHYPVSLLDSVSLANLGADFEVFGSEAVISAGEGRTYGFEFSYQKKLTHRFYGIMAYTLYWSEFSGIAPGEFLPSSWDNRHLFSFTGGYRIGRSWELGMRFRVLGKAPFPQLNRAATLEVYPAQVFDYSTLGEQRLGVFNALDIRIDRQWNFAGWSLNAYLEIQNILSSELPEAPLYGLRRDDAGQVAAPREIVEVEQTGSGRAIPTIGIVVDF